MNNDNDYQPSTKNWATAITFLTLLAFFMVLNAKMVAPFLLTVLMGGILSILFYPYYVKLREKNFSQFWSSTIVTISVSLIIIVPLVFFALIATKQGIQFAKSMSGSDGLSFDSIAEKISHLSFIQPLVDDPSEVRIKMKEFIEKASTATVQSVLAIVGNLPDLVLQLFLAVISCFFFLIDGRRFILFLNDKVPLDGDVRMKLQNAFKNTAISVIWATIAAAGAQALIMFLSFLFLGVPGAFLAGGATFIFAWIPFIGSVPVWVAGGIYLYTQDQMGLVITMIILGMFTGIIDNYIRPLVLKGRDELHPLVGLVAIFGGIAMFGIMGVFVGPVFAATLISLLQIWPTVGRRFGLTFDPPTQVVLEKRKTDS
jgi:predicted PurR-regulated permease PerM